MTRPYAGVFPVLPTTFDEHGQLDLESQVRVVDFFLEAGVHGFCILANFSEQFALSDAERDRLTETILRHTRDRVPVIVTTSHYSARVAAERSQRAQALGAAMVMLMPPFHGTIRPDEAGIFEFFRTVSDAIDIPIMVQDSPVSGITLPAAFLARLATEIRQVKYYRGARYGVEDPGAAPPGGVSHRGRLRRRGGHYPDPRPRGRGDRHDAQRPHPRPPA